jgi:hypothetical protein
MSVGYNFITSGMGESQFPDPGSVIRDEQPGSYFLELRNDFFGFFLRLKYFVEDPGWRQIESGMEKSRDPGSASRFRIPDPGSRIRDKHKQKPFHRITCLVSSPSINFVKQTRASYLEFHLVWPGVTSLLLIFCLMMSMALVLALCFFHRSLAF